METSEEGKLFIKGWEDCRLVPYMDSGGVWTNGWGNTINVQPGIRITQAQADDAFDKNIAGFESLLSKAVQVPVLQYEWDALISILYNVGPGRKGSRSGIITLKNGEPSTLLRLVNENDPDASLEFRKWDKVNGVPVRGLTRRRYAETKLFERGIYA